jgi:putative restriction endonuclease
MGIDLVIAVTDGDWFEMLRQQRNLSEVDFWAPSAANFRALQPGEMFLFKLHAPRNVIVGGGIFAYRSASRSRCLQVAQRKLLQGMTGGTDDR